MKPTNVFPGNKDNDLTTQASNIARLMKNLFNITAYKFHPNARHKTWDTYSAKNREKIPSHLRTHFESNRGHSDRTRKAHYVALLTAEELKNLFSATAAIRDEFREKMKFCQFHQ